jgi:quercetin dioxygenase-like cupin family protein
MCLWFVGSPESGVSETVVLRGVVTAGGSFPAHSHDHEEVLYFLSGAGTYAIAGETGSVSAGDVIVVPPRAVHASEATEDLDAIGVLPAGAKTFAPDGTEMPR